ncbi:MAG: ribose 5-phosphate isomerase B [Saprospiraceae bacterium]|nr:ribose 5-phosphate isomerase B [Saprospiraceae bacterium]
MKLAIGGDHAGFEYKEKLKAFLIDNDIEVMDVGPFDASSVDYPDFAHPVANMVEDQSVDFGILICGSGNGVAITANKHKGVRAALCWEESLAALARQHNNANILCLPSRFVSYELAESMAKIFIETPFEGGRHENRVIKIDC